VKLLGKLIQALRQERGITQQSLALSAGCSVGTISKVEQGSIKPGMEMAKNIAHALGREVDIDPESLAVYSEETGLTPEVLVPSVRTGAFAGQSSTAVELLPLLTMAINRLGRAHIEALLRSMADPTLVNTAVESMQAQQRPSEAATAPAAPALVSAKLHGDRVVRIYDKAEAKQAAKAQPMPRRRTA
jgi:transcriptional regulator with XRE-family HTH domain